MRFESIGFGANVPEAPFAEGEFALAPDQQTIFQAWAGPAITPEQLQELDDERLFLYFWGELIYQDVFGKEHTTTWCSRYDNNSPKQLVQHDYKNDMT